MQSNENNVSNKNNESNENNNINNESDETIEKITIEKKNIYITIDKKVAFFNDLIQKTIIHIQKKKLLNILGNSEVLSCINSLEELSKKIKDLSNNMYQISTEFVINNLQIINNDLSAIIKLYGTESLDDLLLICFGSNSISSNEEEIQKYELLKKYFHPTSYKLVALFSPFSNNNEKNIDENTEESNLLKVKGKNEKNLTCSDIDLNNKHFHMKTYGIKVFITNKSFKKNIYIYGFLDNIIINFLNNKYIENIKNSLKIKTNEDLQFSENTYAKYIDSLCLKDYLIYNVEEIENKYVGYVNQNKIFKNKNLQQLVKDFLAYDLYHKRDIIIKLLITAKSETDENNFIAYLLYDLLSNDTNGNIDNNDQICLIDSLPWILKQFFKSAMKNIIEYTNSLHNFDINKIPLEQQIRLLKAPESVKEKAIAKYKEIKSKNEDSGSKARQYLDGLLKIPFQINCVEPILTVMNDIKGHFTKHINRENIKQIETTQNETTQNEIKQFDFFSYIEYIPKKDEYTNIEIIKYTNLMKENLYKILKKLLHTFIVYKKLNELKKYESKINEYIYTLSFHYDKMDNKKKEAIKDNINKFISYCFAKNNINIIINLLNIFEIKYYSNFFYNELKSIEYIEHKFEYIQNYMLKVRETLNNAVYGHEKAKKQIEIVIAQWINGRQSGYCFGFEGCPGIGKTSLAKNGLSKCLIDENGSYRPFAMIQIGGDSNGSTLHGHNYTYVGSTWGSIVQILMDKKCMNPIIFIDEVDKISKTEHGKELIGILTHLLDYTQNDCFQDKYFNGIDLDLSKALFIISYNDPDAIDKILLDRIHRIKFENLTLEDKIVICNKHLLPEIYKKVGLNDNIIFTDEVIRFIIENYTSEVGVRKLKEILFEIVGIINLSILSYVPQPTQDTTDVLPVNNSFSKLPIIITIENIKNEYLKDKYQIKIKKIHKESCIGVINCLYATTGGQSGILIANGKFFPSSKFLELKLTGLLDTMMKESFEISLTLAYNLTDEKTKIKLREDYDGVHKYGIHLHMGDGSINKSGTSAGIAITLLFYSMLNNKKIKNTFAVTGEAGLDGLSNEIGALSQKFLGGINAGVTSFIFPYENKKDYDKFMEKYRENDIIKNIEFYPINNIHEAINLIFE
jgi:ATP-dependent Lon protease